MSLITKAKEAIAEFTKPITPDPTELVFEDGTDLISEWHALGKELGITDGKTPEIELKLFLESEGIRVYSTQSVFDYLTQSAVNSKTVWKLYPVRPKDLSHCNGKPGRVWAECREWPSGHGQVPDRCYRNAIPLPVLLTMKKLVDEFGDDVYFLVAGVDLDPFLGVVLKGSSLIFVERWDAPGYRDR